MLTPTSEPGLPESGQRRFINDLDRFARLLDLSGKLILHQPGAALADVHLKLVISLSDPKRIER
jgi:hypothetical protein